MTRNNPSGDFLQFVMGGCLFGSGVFLIMNQVMVRSDWSTQGVSRRWSGLGSWAGDRGLVIPWGTPGMGLLMIPLAIGMCLLFAGSYQRWARLMIWGSLAALFAGILNSIRLTLIPATLWQLAVYVVMLGSGGGLMFRSLRAYSDGDGASSTPDPPPKQQDHDDLRREIAELKRQLDQKADRGG